MIGEKGVNLSGGQKARVGLARALYSDSDIYLLDDPISAVDIHVARFIIKECFLKYLKGKTIIVNTHALYFLKYMDYLYVLDKGRIVQHGQYDILTSSPEFKEVYDKIMKHFHEEQEATSTDLEEDDLDLPLDSNLEDLKLKGKLSSQKENSASKKNSKPNEGNSEPKENATQTVYDKLINMEDRKKGSVSLQVYWDFVKLNGGVWYVIVLLSSFF